MPPASGDLEAALARPLACITVDGAGFGPDGTVWGGEVLRSTSAGYERTASLEPIPLLTGDRAVREPPRLVYGLHRHLGLECGLYTGREAEIFDKALERSPRTSSFGRILDAVSCHLGAGAVRTYEGEPAVRLERYLEAGEPAMEFPVSVRDQDGRKVVETLPALKHLFSASGVTADSSFRERADASASLVKAVADALAECACDTAEAAGDDRVGLTGGVAFCLPLVRWVDERVRARGLRLVTHGHIPAGDGGISPGQAVLAGLHRA